VKAKLVLSLAVVYLVWGSTFLAVAVSDRSLPPLLMLAARFLLAGGLLYAWSARRGDVRAARPGRREWTAAAIVGGVLLFLNTGAVAWAEQRVASGLTALLIGSVPLFTAVIDRTFFGVRMSLGTLLGIAVGLFGVALLVGPSAHIDPVGAGVILGAALTWAAGSAYARVAPLPPQPMLAAAMQMLCGGVLLALAGVAIGEPSQIHPGSISTASIGAFAYLVVFGSIVAYTAYGWLLRSGTSSVLVSTYAYVNPAVAVVLGWALVGEHVGHREIAAGMVILASVGMLLATRLPREHAGPLAKRLSNRLSRAGA
jgi:drug/metabolite transporter (DMT)-like permease